MDNFRIMVTQAYFEAWFARQTEKYNEWVKKLETPGANRGDIEPSDNQERGKP